MFKLQPDAYDLDKEYRQRTMNRAARNRAANESKTSQPHRPGFLKVNLASLLWIVASIIILVIFLSAGFSTAKAQENTFEEGATGTPIEIVYLVGGIVAIQQNDLDAARIHLDASIEAREDFAPAYIGHSFVALMEEDYELALSMAEQAFEYNPDDNAVYFVLAEAQFAAGNYQEALDHYETYLANVEADGEQAILITQFLNGDSLTIVETHYADCQAALTI